mmetsp:Transcript_3217/g.4794  ORF Transcript_3217/g.4794 Transcript_3217/m.4794 type:complete len:527 (+) Transcript_3217:28-1608(+)
MMYYVALQRRMRSRNFCDHFLLVALLVLLTSTQFGEPFKPRFDFRAGPRLLLVQKKMGPASFGNQGNSPPVGDSLSSLADKVIEFKLHDSLDSIGAEAWNLFLGPSSSPFMEYSWLQCLEKSGCASPETGWAAQHVSVQMNGKAIAYVPLYVKGHSMGEFIFDNSWAEAAYRSGIKYYPKLLVGVPFTPVTGTRMLIDPRILANSTPETITELRRLIGKFLCQIATVNRISSVHLNFLTDEEASSLTQELKSGEAIGSTANARNTDQHQNTAGYASEFMRRTSVQYHWINQNLNNHSEPFQSFDDYLNCFKSKRRITIRRERRRVLEDEQIVIDAIVGTDILKYDGLVERMFAIYRSTVDKMYYGRQYLTLDFFQKLSKSDFCKHLCFICARDASTCSDAFKADDVFAGTFNIVKDGVFYGRYWGVLHGREINSLHFEVCYWSAIEYCIKNGLARMEPGAGGGDYKWARGFDPALIHSVHYISHPGLRSAVRQFLELEMESNVDSTEYLLERSVTGPKNMKKNSNE